MWRLSERTRSASPKGRTAGFAISADHSIQCHHRRIRRERYGNGVGWFTCCITANFASDRYSKISVQHANRAVGAAVRCAGGNHALTRNRDLREWLEDGHDPLYPDELFVPESADRNRR